MIDETLDHVEQAKELAPGRLREKANWENIITFLVNQIQEAEVAANDLITERLIDTAVDNQLVVIGKIAGEDNYDNLADADYRRRIKARIATNRSKGTWEELINICRLVINDAGTTITQTNETRMTNIIELGGNTLTDITANSLILFLRQAVSAGERLILKPNLVTDGSDFVLGPIGIVTSVLVGTEAASFNADSGDRTFPTGGGDAEFRGGTTDSFSYTGYDPVTGEFTGCAGISTPHAAGERVVIINDSDQGLGDTGAPTVGGQLESALE